MHTFDDRPAHYATRDTFKDHDAQGNYLNHTRFPGYPLGTGDSSDPTQAEMEAEAWACASGFAQALLNKADA